ncbi:MAG TPA: hypothetical protein VE398_09730 [Acidobacteriota bacterium]|nr:hypothetical protein [Acidobacteriota bacterium]
MQVVLEYQGQIRLGSLPWEISERLAQLRSNWLEFIPKTSAIIVRQAQPAGCPALTGIACELISIIDSIPPELREAMPGGELALRDSSGPVLQLAVTRGEVRIKWPRKACVRGVPTSPENSLEVARLPATSVRGWARLVGSPSKTRELAAFVDRYGGLYPEEDMPSEGSQNMAYIRFRHVSADPKELIDGLLELAEPRESLQADLEAGRQTRGSFDPEFRIQIVDGRLELTKPVPQL